MTLYSRILATCIAVVVLTVTLSVAVANWTAQNRLTRLVQLTSLTNESSVIRADFLAYFLSQEYTRHKDWAWLSATLYESGYVTRPVVTDFFNLEPRRSVVLDLNGAILFDSFAPLGRDEELPQSEGQRAAIIDLDTGKPVGLLYLDDNSNYLQAESSLFIRRTLLTTVAGGLLTLLLTLLLASWLSRRIASPISALTQAIQSVAEDGATQLLPITTNDEFGRMSSAFNQLATNLSTQQELRKRLVDDISHELNTPLSIIRLEANAMSRGMQSPEEAAKQIVREVETLQTLVYDLSWLAETDTGELNLSLEPYSLNRLLEAEVERWRLQALPQEIDIHLELLPELPSLMLDPTRVSQAIGNVLRNALQHTDAGGEIRVWITLKATPADDRPTAVITITDDGVGVDAADLPHIFERLYRTDQSRSRETGGSGLGLAITRTIIEAHSGTIEVMSKGIDKGMMVRLTLPVSEGGD